jgi:hypothetical protein
MKSIYTAIFIALFTSACSSTLPPVKMPKYDSSADYSKQFASETKLNANGCFFNNPNYVTKLECKETEDAFGRYSQLVSIFYYERSVRKVLSDGVTISPSDYIMNHPTINILAEKSRVYYKEFFSKYKFLGQYPLDHFSKSNDLKWETDKSNPEEYFKIKTLDFLIVNMLNSGLIVEFLNNEIIVNCTYCYADVDYVNKTLEFKNKIMLELQKIEPQRTVDTTFLDNIIEAIQKTRGAK